MNELYKSAIYLFATAIIIIEIVTLIFWRLK